MKIAFVVNTYPPRLGGLEQHLHNLTQGLADLGHEVTVLTIGSPTGKRKDGPVTVLTGVAHFPVADVISFPSLGSRRRITKFLREGGFDVVSVHTRFFPMTFVGMRAARAAGLPVVHTEHGAGFVENNSPVIALASRLVDITLGSYVLRHANRVLAVSEESATFARRLGARKTSIFYNAIPTLPHPVTIMDRPEHLVFVGRLVQGKGWDTYLDVVSALRRDGYNVDGEMLGDGADMDAARERVDALGLSDVVTLRGRCSPDQVYEALQGATLIYPSVLAEGFGIVLLEAMAAKGRAVAFSGPGAVALQRESLPLVITKEKTSTSLIEATKSYLKNPPPPATDSLIAPWTWPMRTREYAEILEQVRTEQSS